jgi:hypothetical protein
MKKLLLLVLVTTFAVGLASCEPQETDPECEADQTLIDGECVDNQEDDTTAPVLDGVEDETIYVDADFDPLDGVSAIDNVDGDITDDIVVTGSADPSTTGTYFLKYSITDSSGNKSEAVRYITVEVDPSLIGDEMIPNGDFSLGWSLWVGEGGGIEGGYGDFEVVDEVLQVTINEPSWNMWEPRLSNRGITVEDGVTYEISFDAKADAPRSIHLQYGQILSAAPWFYDFKAGQQEIFDLDTEWDTYTFKVTINSANINEDADLTQSALIFEMGTVEGEVGTDNLATTIYYDNIVMTESTPDPDTTGPLFDGVDDMTITQGSDFDPLEGVTAIDATDGEVYISTANVIGEVDTYVPGDYEITYTAMDIAGNITIVHRTITVVEVNFIDSEQIVDGGFDVTTDIIAEVQDAENNYADITDPGIWYQYTAGWDGAAATYSVEDGAAVIDITAAGNNDWGIMLKQNGIDLVAGNMYKLVFTASATVERDMIARVTDNFGMTVQLTETPTVYEYVFLYDGEDVEDVMGERVLFLLGNTPNFAAGTVTIDDVMLYIEGEEAAEYYYQDTEQVVDPSFDTTTEIIAEVQDPDAGYADVTDPDVWYQYTADWDGAAATFTVEDGAVVADITASGNNDWGIMLKQKGIELMAGVTYRLTFTASATVDRDIVAKVTDNYFGAFDLTAEPTEFSFTFTADEAVTNERILFMLGATEAFAAGVVTIDDVRLDMAIDPEALLYDDNANLVTDPSFDTTTDIIAEVQDPDAGYADITDPDVWYQYTADWDGAAATFTVEDGAAVADITAAGNNDWGVMLKQKGFDLVNGTVYRLTFTASATVERDIIARVTDNFGMTVQLTPDAQTFEFEFLFDGDDVLNERILFVLGATEAFAAGVVTIDDVSLVPAINTDVLTFVDTEQVVDPSFDTTTDIIAEVQDPDAGYADVTDPDVWYQYTADWDGAAATFTIEDGAAVADITGSGNNDWGVMLKQKGFDLVSGTVYRLTFTASATVDRDVVVKVTDDFFTTVNLTDEAMTYEFTFLFTNDDVTNERILFMLGATPEFAAGIVTIDDVMLYAEEAPVAE